MKAFGAYPSLAGQCAFVTGGASGIGAAIVTSLVSQGVVVGFLDIDTRAGRELAGELNATGGNVWFRRADVCDLEALADTIEAFQTHAGKVDILVNNVANDTRHDWRTVTEASWDASMAVNLRPAFFAIQAITPGMIARGHGSIVNFGSISWKGKHGGMPSYTTAKSAIHGLTRSFVTEFGSSGIRINTVMPGWVLTERQLSEHFGEDGVDILKQHQPMTGTIKAEDVAALVMFLCAEDSAMCTGQEFTIDGGWT